MDGYQTYECTLDSKGRITHVIETSVLSDTTTMIRQYDYTYDAEGRIESASKSTEDVETDGFTETWRVCVAPDQWG